MLLGTGASWGKISISGDVAQTCGHVLMSEVCIETSHYRLAAATSSACASPSVQPSSKGFVSEEDMSTCHQSQPFLPAIKSTTTYRRRHCGNT